MSQQIKTKALAVPGMSWAAVRSKALELLMRVYPGQLSCPQPTPVAELFEGGLSGILGLKYGVADLQGDEALFNPKSRELILDESIYLGMLEDDGRSRFTVSHEIGHAMLHGSYFRDVIRGRREPILLKRTEIPAYQNPEKQADIFASEFLMPSPVVIQLIEEGALVSDITRIFKVSKAAASIKYDQLQRIAKK